VNTCSDQANFTQSKVNDNDHCETQEHIDTRHGLEIPASSNSIVVKAVGILLKYFGNANGPFTLTGSLEKDR